MIGICHHSVHTALVAARRVCYAREVRVLHAEGPVAPCACTVVCGVRVLRACAPRIAGVRTRLMVVDTLQELLTVEGVVVIDHDGPDLGWRPRRIRMRALREELAGAPPPHPPVAFVASTVVDRMVSAARERGVLGSVLAYAQRLSGGPERDAVHHAVAAYLNGRLALATVRRRTAPSKPALVEAHAAMCDALGGDNGIALGRAVRHVIGGMDVREAVVLTGADAFEIRYIIARMKQVA